MDTKHTPGPWHWQDGFTLRPTDDAAAGHVAVILNEDGCMIKRDAPADEWLAEDAANKALIAAAPDLLAALERALDWLSSYPGGNASPCYRQACDAVAKATGK